MQQKIKLYRDFQNKYFKDLEYEEGHEVFLETVIGRKCTILKRSIDKKLIVESFIDKNITVTLDEINKDFVVYKPSLPEIMTVILNLGCEIVLNKNVKKIKYKNEVILEDSKFEALELIKMCLEKF